VRTGGRKEGRGVRDRKGGEGQRGRGNGGEGRLTLRLAKAGSVTVDVQLEQGRRLQSDHSPDTMKFTDNSLAFP